MCFNLGMDIMKIIILARYLFLILVLLLVVLSEGYFLTRKQKSKVTIMHYATFDYQYKENVQYIYVNSFSQLESIYKENGYNCDNINNYSQPKKLIKNIPFDMDNKKYTLKANKYFVCMLIPNALLVNKHVLSLRARLKYLLSKKNLSTNEELLLAKLEKDFAGKRANKADFLARVDAVPMSMMIAQAIVESAWGRSYFARKGNSLFGEWTYKKLDKGIIPRHRKAGMKHRIKAFNSIYDSMYSYIRVFGRGRRYRDLREIRSHHFSSSYMINALHGYSGIGNEYVDILQHTIEKYKLYNLDRLLNR